MRYTSNMSATERPSFGDIHLSRIVAGRMSLYLRCLEGWLREGVTKVSSSQIAEALGMRDEQVAQVRKDLGCLGSMGQPGIGYKVPDLIAAIRHALGLNRSWNAILIGAGNLGRALLKYQGFRNQGFQIVALFDNDPSKINTEIEGYPVYGLDELATRCAACKAELALITVPMEAAQGVADELAKSGIRGILNFAPVVLRLSAEVRLVNVDLAIQLEQLAFQIQTQ
jgi:redox-sensing transcriptional repressor